MRAGTGLRRGMTLVELLVVIIIISVLATLVVALGPGIGERQRSTRGAEQLQSWLLLAKQRALRDQKPRGLRMLPDPSSNYNYVNRLQFIEQPDALLGIIQRVILVPDPMNPSNPPTVYVIADYYPPQPNPRPANPVASADYTGLVNQPIDYNSSGQPVLYDFNDIMQIKSDSYRIVNASPTLSNQPQNPQIPPQTPPINQPPNAPVGTVFQLDRDPSGGNPSSLVGATFTIYRAPQPLAGEAALDLPKDVAIDLTRGYPSGGSGGTLHDLLFSPSGKLMGPLSSYGRVCFWVRDVALYPVTQNDLSKNASTTPQWRRLNPEVIDKGGTHSLITIYTKSGKIAFHPVDPTRRQATQADNIPNSPPFYPGSQVLNDPFSFTKDSLSPGL